MPGHVETARGIQAEGPRGRRLDRAVASVDWAVLGLFAAAALACVVLYGRNIPLVEDWYTVGLLTGHEHNLLGWAWEQNGEHRTPLARLVLLGVLEIFRDYRAAMVLNVALLAASAAVLMLAMRRIRGRPSLADAFFPVAILHLGHWENITFAWQTNFTITFLLICLALRAFVVDPLLTRRREQAVYGLLLLLFPLCGGAGLAFAPFLIVWCALVVAVRPRGAGTVLSGSDAALLACAAASAALMGLYFVGYEDAGAPPPPSLAAALKTAAQFASMGVGPVASRWWSLAVIATAAATGATVVLLAIVGLRSRWPERARALGLVLFLVNLGLFALAIGWGRAGSVEAMEGLPPRYAHLALPLLLTLYAAWTLYGRTLQPWACGALLAVVVLLLPVNTRLGFTEWGHWYRSGMEQFEADLAVERDVDALARKHREFLIPWWTDQELAAKMRMLEGAKWGPFRRTAP